MLVNILIVAGLLVLVGVLILLFIRSGKDTRQDSWKAFAEATQLNFAPQDIKDGRLSATVKGSYCGRDVTLETYRGGGELQTLYTRILLPIDNPTGKYLSVAKKNIFTQIVSRMGVEYVETGDHAFDRKYVVHSRPRGLVSAVFGSFSLRRRLIEARSMEINLVENSLQIAIRGFVNDVETLKTLINIICEMADSVDRAIEEPGMPSLPAQA